MKSARRARDWKKQKRSLNMNLPTEPSSKLIYSSRKKRSPWLSKSDRKTLSSNPTDTHGGIPFKFLRGHDMDRLTRERGKKQHPQTLPTESQPRSHILRGTIRQLNKNSMVITNEIMSTAEKLKDLDDVFSKVVKIILKVFLSNVTALTTNTLCTDWLLLSWDGGCANTEGQQRRLPSWSY